MSPDDIARRLREEGMAKAPPDLAPEVMREVAWEPQKRRRSRPRWRPVAAWATAAAAVAAGVFAISQLGGSHSASSSSSGEATRGPALGATASIPPGYSPLHVYTVASRDAERILQAAGVAPLHMSYLAPHHRRIVAAVPRRELGKVADQLQIAEQNPAPGPKVHVRIVPRR
jgi:hypothetical protein